MSEPASKVPDRRNSKDEAEVARIEAEAAFHRAQALKVAREADEIERRRRVSWFQSGRLLEILIAAVIGAGGVFVWTKTYVEQFALKDNELLKLDAAIAEKRNEMKSADLQARAQAMQRERDQLQREKIQLQTLLTEARGKVTVLEEAVGRAESNLESTPVSAMPEQIAADIASIESRLQELIQQSMDPDANLPEPAVREECQDLRLSQRQPSQPIYDVRFKVRDIEGGTKLENLEFASSNSDWRPLGDMLLSDIWEVALTFVHPEDPNADIRVRLSDIEAGPLGADFATLSICRLQRVMP